MELTDNTSDYTRCNCETIFLLHFCLLSRFAGSFFVNSFVPEDSDVDEILLSFSYLYKGLSDLHIFHFIVTNTIGDC